MQLARRLYLYFIAAVSLLALAIGLTNLLELLIGALRDAAGGPNLLAGDADAVRRDLSIFAAIVIVALPIWLLHWWLAERGLRGADGDEERRSTARALYLTAVLGGAFVAGTVAATELVQAFTHWIVDSGGGGSTGGIERWLALVVIATAIWAYHGWVRLRDMRDGPLDAEADWLPRLYVYGAAFVGLTLLAFAVGDLLALVIEVVTTDDRVLVGTGVWDGLLASGVSRALVGMLVWVAHWQYSLRLTAAPDWRGQHARASALHRFYGYAVAFGAVVMTLLLVTRVGEALLSALLDAVSPDAEPFPHRLLDPAVRAVPFIVAWAYHRRRVLAEAASWSEGAKQATVRRIYVYAIALIGLALTGYGLSRLIAVSIDRTSFGDSVVSSPSGDPWRAEVAQLASLTIVGAAAWLWHWYRAQSWLRLDPVAEQTATVRRAYLFASIAGSIVALLVSLAVVIYRLFAEILGVEATDGLVEELSQPFAVLLVAAALLAYHATLLRADLGERETPTVDEVTSFQVVVTGPAGADAAYVVASIQSSLPDGFVVHTVPRSD